MKGRKLKRLVLIVFTIGLILYLFVNFVYLRQISSTSNKIESSCPCLHGGICVDGSAICKCKLGWKGDFCEISVGEHSNEQSKNCDCRNGVCDSEKNCFCHVGYYGNKCELKKHIKKYHIQNLKHVQENEDSSLITVLILHNDSEHDLKKTLQSFRKQTHEKYESFILDYSKNGLKLDKKYFKNSNKLLVLRCRTEKKNDALNMGMMLANGKYSAFVHSGDLVDSNFLSNLIQNKNPVLFIDTKKSTNFYELNIKNTFIFQTALHKILNNFEQNLINDFWLKANNFLPMKFESQPKTLVSSNKKEILENSLYIDMMRRKEISSLINYLYVDSKTYLEIKGRDKKFKKIKIYKGKSIGNSLILIDSSTLSMYKLPNRQRKNVCVVVVYRKESQDEIYQNRFIFESSIDLIFTKHQKTAQRIHLFHPNVFMFSSSQDIVDASFIHCNYLLYSRNHHKITQNLPFPEISQLERRKLHVALQVDHFDFPGGLERVVMEIAIQLRKNGISMTLINCGRVGPPYNEMKKLGFKTYTLSSTNKIEEYRRIIKKENFSIINAHYSLLGVKMIKDMGIPFIQTIHNEYTWLNEIQRNEFRSADRYTSAYTCVSSTVAMYSDLSLGLDVKKMMIVRNGVDKKRFNLRACKSPVSIRQELNLSENDFIFLQSGSLVPIKAPHVSIKAMKKVVERIPKAKLILIGKGMDFNFPKKLNEMIQEYHLENHVKILGHRDDVPCLLNSIDAVLHPSLLEGWCLAIAEAIFMDKRVIVSDTGGNQDVVDEYGVKGSIVMKSPYKSILRDDVNQIANKENPEYVEKLANHMIEMIKQEKPDVSGREEIKKKLSTKYMYKAYGRIYEWIFAKKSPETIKDLLRINYW